MLPSEVIIKKREKKRLTKEEIDFFVKGISNNSIDDAQIASFTMAVLLNKLSIKEKIYLTSAMAKSGKTLSYPKSLSPIVDKHSTGGVGDKVSLMLAPIVACLGIYDAMIAGRGLGHTGGTIDKLESIPGYNCYPNEKNFEKVIKDVGCGIMGATADIAPADKRMYAVRDTSGTVESIDLILSSILSKKIAAGLQGLVMDVKYGNGAFMKTKSDAQKLAKYIEKIGTGSGVLTKAILTDMNSVLGRNVGNSLEVLETIDFLKGDYDKRLYKITEALIVEMVILAKKITPKKFSWAKNSRIIKKRIKEVIDNGSALRKFQEMVFAMGGPKDLIETPNKYLKLANFSKKIYPNYKGKVRKIDTYTIGLALIELKGGRTHPKQPIDYSVGFENFCSIGDIVNSKTPLAIIYASSKKDLAKAEKMIKNSIIVK